MISGRERIYELSESSIRRFLSEREIIYMNQSLPLHKLFILETLNNVNFPLSNNHLTEFLIRNHYADYFEIQQTFSELISSSLIAEETVHHSTRYSITEEGRQTLLYYKDLIPDSFLDVLAGYLKENEIKLRNSASAIAGYTPVKTGEFAVECRIIEKNTTIFDATMLVPSEDMAERMCFNWEKKQAQIYSYMLSQLMDET